MAPPPPPISSPQLTCATSFLASFRRRSSEAEDQGREENTQRCTSLHRIDHLPVRLTALRRLLDSPRQWVISKGWAMSDEAWNLFGSEESKAKQKKKGMWK